MNRKTDTPSPLQQRFVSEMELAQLTGISRRTWQKHRQRHRGPRYYKICGAVRYDVEETLVWIKGQVVHSGQAA